MAPDVMVVGALHLDVIVTAPHLPGKDETLMGSAVAYAFGGKGGNQAVAAAHLGADTAMAGRIGDDSFATTIRAALDAAGIDSTQVRQAPGASGMSVAILDAAGDYGAVVVSGVNLDIRTDEVDLPADLPVLILQNEIPEAINASLIPRLGPATTLILNAAPARSVSPEILARTDILIVNRVEAAMLTGQDGDHLDPITAAASLRALGPKAVIVTLGADGLVADDGASHIMPAHRVKALSTHGAGDVFVGALAARIAAGDALLAACKMAQAAAALHVAQSVSDRQPVTPARLQAFLSQTR